MTLKIGNDMRKFFDRMPGMWGCKNEQSAYQYANAEFAKVHGVSNHLDLIDATAFDLPTDVAACAEIFHQQERQIMETNQTFKLLNVQPWAHGWGIGIFTKMPWRDEQDKIVGTIFHGIEITDAYSTKLGEQLARWTGNAQNSYVLGDALQSTALSTRESEILFLIIRGKTAKLAAATLGISYRTVQQYIDTLKAKFNVGSKVELIDAAMARGYLNQIPLSLFSKQLSVVLAAE